MNLNPIAANMTELELSDGTTVLFSYKTPVAAFVPGRGILRTDKHFSQTTTRHINKWMKGHGPVITVTPVPQSSIEALLNP